MGFRKDFVWGAATAAYQVEGAADRDGRGPCVWDMMCRIPGKVWNGHSGKTSSDHYHRYKEDVALMRKIGLKGYRFSFSWSRILPEGTGRINQKGLDFYDRLIDELLKADIRPFATMFHWDYPYELFCRGGWLNRDSSDWFADYVRVLADNFSDRVKFWMTLNEPQCFIYAGHGEGVHAPGLVLGTAEILRAGHHALMAHGKAVQVMRTIAGNTVKVSYAPIGTTRVPATNDPKDIKAAKKAMFSCTYPGRWEAAWWMDPVYLGHYPADGLEVAGKNGPPIKDGDMKIIHQKLDVFSYNLYEGVMYGAGKEGVPEKTKMPDGSPITMFEWAVMPEAMYWSAKFFYERYKLPLLITENGLSNPDWVSVDGKVHDPQRIDFTRRYLKALEKAVDEGVDVLGYFHWSLMDNFEWAHGFKHRFGLIHVDYPTGKRTLKDSAYWYSDVIKTNGKMIHKN